MAQDSVVGMRKIVNQIAGMAGCEVIAKWRLGRLPAARRTEEIFKSRGITSVIDVGANVGQFHDFLRGEVGFDGWIYSFEPVPRMAATLIERCKADARWKVFPFALGPEPGQRSLNEMSDDQFTSFLSPVSSLPVIVQPLNKLAATHQVEVRTLDSMEGEFPDLAHTYLKIDTQGFDLEVLRGGHSVAAKVPALQTEVSFHRFYEGMPDFSASMKAFGEAGFVISDFFLVAQDKDFRAFEFDCLMVRG
jgi:FkbM family methyltransferase